MSRDPFKLTGPTCLSFSGGRSSAFMLWRTLQANTPEDIARWLLVIFCNTGKEHEATLLFVRRCGVEWGVPIIWLEYRLGSQFVVVDFDLASRLGEPFEAIIQQRGFVLPNVRSAYCSSELKTRTTHRYLRSIGWAEWESFVGIRADEAGRVAKFRANPSPETPSEEVVLPLADSRVTKWDVSAFWVAQSFDLDLPNINGETPGGNCDLCFKKKGARVMSLIRHEPVRAVWWLGQEAIAARHADGDGALFRNNRASYAQMHRFALQQEEMPFDPFEADQPCGPCGD